MDMSFANQALGAEYMVKNHATLGKKVYSIPQAIDAEIARLKLASMGVVARRPHAGAGEIPGGLGEGRKRDFLERGSGPSKKIFLLRPYPRSPHAAPRPKKTFGTQAARRGGSDPDSPNRTKSDVRNR